MRRASDGQLTRSLKQLRSASPDDIELVLEQLAPEERETVERLLAGEFADTGRVEASNSIRPQLVPWLMARLATAATSDRLAELGMTPSALDALQDCARRLWPGASWRGTSPSAPSPKRRRFLDLIGGSAP